MNLKILPGYNLVLLCCILTFFACKADKEYIPELPDDEPFDKVPAIEDIAMYEINLRVFSPAQNLRSAQERLAILREMGINLIWLMPIHPTGEERSVGSPYAIKDYLQIHPDYGTLEDLKAFVDKAHELEMAVILDWVANHTAWDNDWINNPDWYAQNSNGEIIHPPGTNWQDVAELNYDNTDMRQAMIQAMKYWVETANIDGYRCDFASGAPDDFWEAAIDTLRSIPDRQLILFAESNDKGLLDTGFDLIFGWNFYNKLKEIFYGSPADPLYNTHLSEYNDLQENKHVVRWITNHDEHAWDDTPQSIFNTKEGTIAAFIMASYMGGVPLVYNGQEVVVPNQLPFFEGNNVAIDWTLNPEIFSQYQQLLNFRKESNALRKGSLTDYSTTHVVAFKRQFEGEEVLVIVNARNVDRVYEVPTELANSTWQNAFDDTTFTINGTIELSPYQYFILKQ